MNPKQDQQLPLRERNRLRTRNDILDAAAEALGEAGYAGTSLEVLSQRAGISRGTLYAHFPGGRDDIVREVYLRVADAVYVRGITLRDKAADSRGRIVALATAFLEATSSPSGRFYGVVGADIVPILSTVMGGTSRSFKELIKLDLAEAKSAGELPPEASVTAIATAIEGAIRASGARAANEPNCVDEQLHVIGLLVQGLLGLPTAK